MLDQVSRAAPALLAATKTPPGDAASGFNCFGFKTSLRAGSRTGPPWGRG